MRVLRRAGCTTCTISVRTADKYGCPFCRGGRSRANSCAVCLGPVTQTVPPSATEQQVEPGVRTECILVALREPQSPVCSSSPTAVDFFSSKPGRLRPVVAQCGECWQHSRQSDQHESLACECWPPRDRVHEACALLHLGSCDARTEVKLCRECNRSIDPPDLPVSPSSTCGYCFSINTHLHQACLTWHEQQHTRCPIVI